MSTLQDASRHLDVNPKTNINEITGARSYRSPRAKNISQKLKVALADGGLRDAKKSINAISKSHPRTQRGDNKYANRNLNCTFEKQTP